VAELWAGTPEQSGEPGGRCDHLCNPARLAALAESGVGDTSDPEMEVIAQRVRRRLGVPVALVSLVQRDQQVFPGMVGLPEPWAAKRATPLSHSFCQYVVQTAEPLVITDAREHPLGRDNLAVPELGVVAYAGMPLTDSAGNVLGSLAAIDTRVRHWTADELEALHELAWGCSGELRLRLARADADGERRRRDELERALRRSIDRNQIMLGASQAFQDATTVADVQTHVGDLLRGELRPGFIGMALLGEDGQLHWTPDPGVPAAAKEMRPWTECRLDEPLPTATAVRERRIVHHADRAEFDAAHPEPGRRLLRAMGLHAVVAVPLVTVDGPVGAIMLGWYEPRRLEPADLLTVSGIAGFAAQAIARARLLQHRSSVAFEMQQALLTTLPEIPGLVMAARYQPADGREQVGGDLYDVTLIPDPRHPGRHALTVSVGDVIGHNLHAVKIMGQVRSMLRQSAWDHPSSSPARVFSAFEQASIGLEVGATGTALLTQLRRRPAGRWSMNWTNAGHPAPVLLTRSGSTVLLAEHDVLFGFPGLQSQPRRDHHCEIPPGSTLFLYTDGLIERRGRDLDTGTEQLVRLLEARRDHPPADIVDAAMRALAVDSPDDVVALAIRFGG